MSSSTSLTLKKLVQKYKLDSLFVPSLLLKLIIVM